MSEFVFVKLLLVWKVLTAHFTMVAFDIFMHRFDMIIEILFPIEAFTTQRARVDLPKMCFFVRVEVFT